MDGHAALWAPAMLVPTTTTGRERARVLQQLIKERISFSQNHRMFWVGRDLWGSSSPTPLPKQDHLEQVAQDFIQAGFEHLQRRIHNLPGQLVPVLRHPQSEEVLPCVELELPVLQFVPVVPFPVTGHHRKESGPVLLTPTFKILTTINAYKFIRSLSAFSYSG